MADPSPYEFFNAFHPDLLKPGRAAVLGTIRGCEASVSALPALWVELLPRRTETTPGDPTMLRPLTGEIYRRIRKHGGLSKKDVGRAIGRSHQTIWRWEATGQMPTRQQEAKLFEAANLTPEAFLEILCEVLSPLVPKLRVITVPSGDGHSPRGPLARATALFRASYLQLDAGARTAVEEMLVHCRLLDALVERTCSLFEQAIVRRIAAAA